MTMNAAGETNCLADGLRALEMLARHAPLDLQDFARLSGETLDRASALVDAFEQCGYVVRLARSKLYVLSELALPIVKSCNPAGKAVARAGQPGLPEFPAYCMNHYGSDRFH